MLIRSAHTGPVLPELHRRLRWLVLVVAAALFLLIGRLWQLQIVRGDRYFERALSNAVQKRHFVATRGRILDINGVPLADNRPAYNVYVVPRRFDGHARQQLADLLKLSDEELDTVDQRVRIGVRRGSKLPVMVLRDQSPERASLIEQESFRMPGVEVAHEAHRTYPNGNLAAHLLGYMNRITAEELARSDPDQYGDTDVVGRYGVERKWETYLRGHRGYERFVANARGQRVDGAKAEELIKGVRRVAPKAGLDVVLTIDIEVQRLVERAVTRFPAAAVVVSEVKSGRLLAVVSKPSFDSNVMTGNLTRQEEKRLNSDPRMPRLDKTLRLHYPPGSIYKFVLAAAAMEDAEISPEETFYCSGQHEHGHRTFGCTGSHGNIALAEAIQHSCNIYFWKLAERVGIDRMAEMAREFGLGVPTGLGINGDVSGRVPTRAWYERRTTFKTGYTLNAATGQGDVEVTVMQMAMAYNALANGGDLFVPQVVARFQKRSGEVVIELAPKRKRARRVKVSLSTLRTIQSGMYMTVNTPGGTAYDYARSSTVEYSGKTGTAQVRSKKKPAVIGNWNANGDHAWFAGFAPSSAPEISVVVLIEHGGPGGKVAAPVARRIVEGYFAHKRKVAKQERARDQARE